MNKNCLIKKFKNGKKYFTPVIQYFIARSTNDVDTESVLQTKETYERLLVEFVGTEGILSTKRAINIYIYWGKSFKTKGSSIKLSFTVYNQSMLSKNKKIVLWKISLYSPLKYLSPFIILFSINAFFRI